MSYSFVKSAILGAALLNVVCVSASAKELIIGIDISDSAPLAMEPAIAARAGSLLRTRIAKMKSGDMVKLRSLGIYGAAEQSLYLNVRLSRKARPHKVARGVDQLIRNLPALVKSGKITLQNETNIIGFLQGVAPSLDCTKNPTTILILSDGIEHSSYIKGRALLSGKKKLPVLSSPTLKGCTLEMRGLAQQHKKLKSDPRWFQHLKQNWSRFARAAGVKRFKAFAEYQ